MNKQQLAQVRLLLWLKVKLVWRLYTRNTSALVGTIIAVVLFLPFSLGIGVACYFGFRLLEPPLNVQLLRAVLVGAYLMWLFSPVLGFALTEEYDLAKLLLYPVSPRVMVTAAILSSVVDLGVILLLPTLLAAVVGFTRNLATFAMTALAVALLLFHTVGVTEVLRLSLWGVLRSRRGRDVLMILGGMIAFGFAAAIQILPRRAIDVNWSRLLSGGMWNVLDYSPPGFAARAVGAATDGHYLVGLLLLLALAALAAGTVWVEGWLVHLIHAGEVITGKVARPAAAKKRPVRRRRPREAALRSPRLSIRLPAVVEAVASKDAKYLVRDPYFKFSLMGALYLTVIFLAMFLWHPGPRHGELFPIGEWMVWAFPLFLLMMQAQFAFNIFGLEGPAVSLLFAFPSNRKQILIGKNLPVFVALVCITSVFTLLFCVVVGSLVVFPAIVLWIALATVMLISVGNLTSMWAPMRVVMRGWRMQVQSSGRSMFQGLVSLVMLGIAGLLSLPVVGGLLIPVRWLGAWWLALTIPLVVAYTAACYVVSLHLAEGELARRDVEIIEKLSETD